MTTVDPITQAREALAEFDKTPNELPRKATASYDCVNMLRALIEHAEKLAQDSATGQQMHAHWQERSEKAEAERDAAIKNRDEWASRMMECVTHVGPHGAGVCYPPAPE